MCGVKITKNFDIKLEYIGRRSTFSDKIMSLLTINICLLLPCPCSPVSVFSAI